MANKDLIMDEELFEDLMQKPYRAWIDHYLKTTDLPKMEQELGQFFHGRRDEVSGRSAPELGSAGFEGGLHYRRAC
jgi:hypothetical protein